MAQQIAEWKDVASDDAVNKTLLSARSVLDEVIIKHDNVTNKQKKVCETFTYTMSDAEAIARMTESDTDVNNVTLLSNHAVNNTLLLARSVLDEVSRKHENVTNKLKKVFHTLDLTMSRAEARARMTQSGTDLLVATEKHKEIDTRVTWARFFFDIDSIELKLKNVSVSSRNTLSPASQKELKTFMENLFTEAQTILRMIKRVDKMLDWVFGPLAA